ncbi:MAG: nuclear transport factor 2 family protein [Flavobacteriaceae bacterium]|jgi:ketosteroid isomerase-like protein|nr:nuclear transport factor 2 family protein [Flavobacteriaceae bacterium]
MKKLFYLMLFFPTLFFAQEKDILKVLENQQISWNSGDLEGFMNGYWNSDSLVFIGSKGATFGWKNTLDNYKKSYPTKEKMGILEFSDLKIKMLGKNYASVFGKWKLTRENDIPNGIYTLIFQKFKDGWKIIQDHTE